MKPFYMLCSAICVAFSVFVTACSGSDSIEPDKFAEAKLNIVVTDPRPSNNGFESPRDTTNVGASVSGDRGNRFDGGKVTWSLRLFNGQPAGDSIGAITSTGPRTARIIFRAEGLVGIEASLDGNDGLTVSRTIYIVFRP